jgi:hypothetical protein
MYWYMWIGVLMFVGSVGWLIYEIRKSRRG